MSRLRFSMTGLMLVVALFALSFAALRSTSDVWANVLFNIVLLMLLMSIIAAVYSAGAHRAFWIGFAVLGLGHWLVGYIHWSPAERLLSTSLGKYLYGELEPSITKRAVAVAAPSGPPGAARSPTNPSRSQILGQVKIFLRPGECASLNQLWSTSQTSRDFS